MRCHRKILRISYKDHVTNEEVHAKIQQAIGSHEDLPTIVKRRKQQRWRPWLCARRSCLKLLGTSDLLRIKGRRLGGRRQCRQRKRWEENVGEWTGLEFGRSQRAVENTEKWRRLVAKSFVVSHRPSRLRDTRRRRWWWWWWCFEVSYRPSRLRDRRWWWWWCFEVSNRPSRLRDRRWWWWWWWCFEVSHRPSRLRDRWWW